MNLLSGLAEWMCKPETGTLSGFRVYSDLSSELCDDTLADRKTETGAGNKIIEFDKTVEYSRLLFRFDSYTRILYGEFCFFSFYLVTDGYTPSEVNFNALTTKFDNTW